MSTWKKVAGLVAAGALTLAVTAPAFATVTLATITDHQASTAESNDASFWGDNCTKLDISGVDSYVLTQNYDLVVVKAGSSNGGDPNSLTLFGDSPSAGETVWADSNGNGLFDVGGPGGDHQISHIIVCGEGETSSSSSSSASSSSSSSASSTASESSSSSESHSQTVSGTSTSSSPTEPNTATIGETGSSNGSSAAWLLLAALGALLGSVVVLAPSRAKNKE